MKILFILAVILVGCGVEDKDGDGFAVDVDCCDIDVRAFPGQTMFFTTPINNEESFDFDCNGIEEFENPDLSDCFDENIVLCESRLTGWWLIVPECGQIGDWVLLCGMGARCYVSPQTETKIQACR